MKDAVGSQTRDIYSKESLEALRAKYGKELELALAEKAVIERRLQSATKQFDEQNQVWVVKLSETERALAKVQTDASQIALDKKTLESRFQQLEAERSQAEVAVNRLQEDSRQIAAQKQELFTKLQQIAMTFSLTEKSAAELQKQAHQLSAEKTELQTRLQQAEAKRIEVEQSAEVTAMKESLIELRAKLGLEESRKQELEIRLAKADKLAEESERSLAQMRADFQRSQSELGEFRTRLTAALAARREAEARLQEANQQLESMQDKAPTDRSGSQTQLREAEDRAKLAEQTMSSWRAEAIRVGAVLQQMTASRAELSGKVKQIQTVRAEVESLLKVQNVKSALEQQRKIPAKIVQPQPALPAVNKALPAVTSKGISSGPTLSSVRLDAAVARLEVMLADVVKLIDEPAASLSTVRRKNAENAEVELKGPRLAPRQDFAT